MTRRGFTLIELLVVMVILGILAVVVLANFRTSQAKARDVQRKANLRQIVNALEAYMNDHGGYPPESLGKIKACGCLTPVPCNFGGSEPGEFCDENNTVYMKEVPGDPTGNPNFCYWSSGISYKLYAKLENSRDPDCLEHDSIGNCRSNRTCAGVSYNFGIASSNTTP